MTKKITESNYNSTTKQVIFEAYKEVLAQLEAAQSQKLDPTKELSDKKNAEVISQAENTASKSIEDQIASLQKNITGILVGLSNNFATEIEAYNNLKQSIQLKEQELQELFAIEKEAFTLAALIDTNRAVVAKQKEENDQAYQEAVEKLNAVNEEIKQARIKFEEEIKAQTETIKLNRKRDEENYMYEFNRRKQREQDELADQLAAERKEFEEEVETAREDLRKDQAALDAREEVVSQREEKMEELEAQVAAFPAKEAKIREEVAEQVKKDTERVEAIKSSYARKEAESQKQIYENKIQLLEDSLKAEQAKNSEQAAKLDAAYEKIQAMALASVDGSKAQMAAADLAKSLMNNKQ